MDYIGECVCVASPVHVVIGPLIETFFLNITIQSGRCLRRVVVCELHCCFQFIVIFLIQ